MFLSIHVSVERKGEQHKKKENFLINSYLTKNHDKLILTKSNRVKYAAFASESR